MGNSQTYYPPQQAEEKAMEQVLKASDKAAMWYSTKYTKPEPPVPAAVLLEPKLKCLAFLEERFAEYYYEQDYSSRGIEGRLKKMYMKSAEKAIIKLKEEALLLEFQMLEED